MGNRSCHLLLQRVAGVLLSVMSLGLCQVALAVEHQWLPPLSELPDENLDHALVVVLITNDVATEWAEGKVSRRTSAGELCWCRSPFLKAVSGIPSGLFHSSAPVYWQHWPVGLPPILTGGEKVIEPGRAVVVVTDGDYRILELFVGIPSDEELSRLLGDAEDTRRWMRQNVTQPSDFTKQIADRNRERMSRLWKRELDRQLIAMGESPDQDDAGLIEDNERFTEDVKVRFGPLAAQLQTLYLKDVQLRFGLTQLSDFERLIVLEQHSATRMPWTLTITPFLAGADLKSVYLDLIEIVWDRQVMSLGHPGEDSKGDESLGKWISQLGEQHPFALEIRLPLLSERGEMQLAPVSAIARRRGFGWKDLDAALSESPIRQVTNRELAAWLLRHNERPLDLSRPSRARYLFFRSSKDHPYPIRDGEPPARSITMIRQVQK
ncbi:hypothetical protein [Aporhodopirellula aestuarii]|uniref:Uncharacterized protein n=1 Tax=Aporhodopirellula aestuarii TaxID=2950107 RepID=A0ABT0U2J8_9BACT|nr:hypothetical protein [Aporhodopirellula aestuarii]MCM2371102.1 hypothetical protein [Aporhodopirellula aestuarii]